MATTLEPTPTRLALADTPRYAITDVADYLKLQPWHAFALARGLEGVPWPPPAQPTFTETEYGDPLPVTFRLIAEIFVRAGAIDAARASKSEAGRLALMAGFERSRAGTLPFDADDATRADVVARQFSELDSLTKGAVRRFALMRSERVEIEDATPLRLFPLTRDPGKLGPRLVALDPLYRGGSPTVTGKSMPIYAIMGYFRGGDSLSELPESFNLTLEEVEELARFEAMKPT